MQHVRFQNQKGVISRGHENDKAESTLDPSLELETRAPGTHKDVLSIYFTKMSSIFVTIVELGMI